MGYPKIITNPTNRFVDEIEAEVNAAIDKHPQWPTDVIYMGAIVQEECGEMIRACVQYALEGGNIYHVRKELIQTAAMCIRMLNALPKSR